MMWCTGKERQMCSGLIPSAAEKQFWSFSLLVVMWSFQRLTYFSLDIASLILHQPDKMTTLTFCLCCQLHTWSIRRAVFCYPEKWATLPARVCPVCQSTYLHECIPTRIFFLTSPIITHTPGSTKIWQCQQRFLLQEMLMGTAGFNFTPDPGACGLDISGQACTTWSQGNGTGLAHLRDLSHHLLYVCQHKASCGSLCTAFG